MDCLLCPRWTVSSCFLLHGSHPQSLLPPTSPPLCLLPDCQSRSWRCQPNPLVIPVSTSNPVNPPVTPRRFLPVCLSLLQRLKVFCLQTGILSDVTPTFQAPLRGGGRSSPLYATRRRSLGSNCFLPFCLYLYPTTSLLVLLSAPSQSQCRLSPLPFPHIRVDWKNGKVSL